MDIFSERTDYATLVPFLDRMNQYLPQPYQNIVADAGYESEENYVYLAKQGQNCYIKPQNYEQTKTRKYRQDLYRVENMVYDPEKDVFSCPQGHSILPVFEKRRKSKTGYVATTQVYECSSCDACPVKPKCTKAAGNRRLQVARTFQKYRQEAYQNITSPFGILLRMNRSIQVEGAFGVLKEDHGFRRFLMRGKKNVRTEYLLLSLGYNINKLHAKIQNERCQMLLHPLEVA